MRFSSFIYLVGQGLHNLRANRLMTFASMGVLTVCMLLIGAASLLGVNIDHMVEYIGNQNETVVYMGGTGESEVATDEQIAAADAAIRSTPHVVSVTYMSPEDVLATYSDMLKDYTNLQQVFANDNPFTPNYRVTVDDPDNIEEVSAQLMQIDGVYSVKAPLAMADTFMVGMLGEAPMAGVALANIPIFVVQLFFFGVQSGSTVLISQYWGKGDREAINRVIGVALWAVNLVSVTFALVLLLFPVPFLSLFGNEPEVVALAAEYGRLIGLSYVFNGMTLVYLAAWRSMERPRLGMYILAVSMGINTFLNWVLIFGKLGAPALGVTGPDRPDGGVFHRPGPYRPYPDLPL